MGNFESLYQNSAVLLKEDWSSTQGFIEVVSRCL